MPTHNNARIGLPSRTCPWWSMAPYTPQDNTAPATNTIQLIDTPLYSTS